MEIKKTNILELTLYSKGATWYCDYYFYNGDTYEKGTTKATGYGYDKHSTALSNAINLFNYLFTFKRGIKWDGHEHATIKNRTFYGCDNKKYISYGIGADSVVNCLGLFNNVKLIQTYNGKNEDFFKIEITTSKEQIKKEFIKNDKKANDKKTTKEERKELIANNKKILSMLEGGTYER